jgi:tripartite-type tricarboxylate transporter receptor subunit TctC
VPYQPFAIWNGFFGRAGMPSSTIARLNAEINRATNSQEVISKMDAAVPIAGTAEQFASYVREQTEAFASIAKLLHIAPE